MIALEMFVGGVVERSSSPQSVSDGAGNTQPTRALAVLCCSLMLFMKKLVDVDVVVCWWRDTFHLSLSLASKTNEKIKKKSG